MQKDGQIKHDSDNADRKNKKVAMTVSLLPETHAALLKLATESRRKKGEVARIIIEDHLSKKPRPII